MRKNIYKCFRFLQKWIDNITTAVASVLIFAMFVVLIANVILRPIPAGIWSAASMPTSGPC